MIYVQARGPRVGNGHGRWPHALGQSVVYQRMPDGSYVAVPQEGQSTLEEMFKDEGPIFEDKPEPDFCLRSVQNYLLTQGRVPGAAVTGFWNRETEDALRYAFPNPRSVGTCTLLARITTGAALGPVSPAPTSSSEFPTGAVIGAGVVVAGLIAAMLFASRAGGPPQKEAVAA